MDLASQAQQAAESLEVVIVQVEQNWQSEFDFWRQVFGTTTVQEDPI